VLDPWPTRAGLRSGRSGRPRVLQIGAGFIGCIILEALANRGVSLTVVEMGGPDVPRMMGQGAGGMIKRGFESKGIKVHTSTRVEAIEPGPSGALTVRLKQRRTGRVRPGDIRHRCDAKYRLSGRFPAVACKAGVC